MWPNSHFALRFVHLSTFPSFYALSTCTKLQKSIVHFLREPFWWMSMENGRDNTNCSVCLGYHQAQPSLYFFDRLYTVLGDTDENNTQISMHSCINLYMCLYIYTCTVYIIWCIIYLTKSLPNHLQIHKSAHSLFLTQWEEVGGLVRLLPIPPHYTIPRERHAASGYQWEGHVLVIQLEGNQQLPIYPQLNLI